MKKLALGRMLVMWEGGELAGSGGVGLVPVVLELTAFGARNVVDIAEGDGEGVAGKGICGPLRGASAMLSALTSTAFHRPRG